MATTVFNFPVQAQDSGQQEYIVRRAQFGDGYEQSAGWGLNGKKKTWSITYSGRKSDVDEVISFLEERQGWQSFLWRDPTGSLGLYKALSFQVVPYAEDVWRLTATFEQSYGVSDLV